MINHCTVKTLERFIKRSSLRVGMDRDTFDRENRQIISTGVDAIVGLLQGAAYAVVGLAGEFNQVDVFNKTAQYTWWTGHLSDLAGSSMVTAVSLSLFRGFDNYSQKTRLLSVIVPPSLCTLVEFTNGSGAHKGFTFDPQDIACYFAGSLVAYGVFEGTRKAREYLSSRRQSSTLEETVL